MIDPKAISKREYCSDALTNGLTLEGEDTWSWYNRFRSFADYSPKIKLALELSADLPSKEELLRWLGESVELLIIPSDIFINNAKNYPVLSKAHQEAISRFLKMSAHVAIKANIGEVERLTNCVEYVRNFIKITKSKVDPLQG